jgi:hypothetical protein
MDARCRLLVFEKKIFFILEGAGDRQGDEVIPQRDRLAF